MSESLFKKEQERKIRKYGRQLCKRFKCTNMEMRNLIEKRLKHKSYRITDPKKVNDQIHKLSQKMLLNNQLLKSETLKR